MEVSPKEQFKIACKQYLLTRVDIGGLRAYGRRVGIAEPTKLNKLPLVEKIVDILAGDLAPEERSKRGAPLKNDYFNPNIIVMLTKLREKYLGAGLTEDGRVKPIHVEPPFLERVEEFRKENAGNMKLEFRQDDGPLSKTAMEMAAKPVYNGQLQLFDGYAMLLPLNCIDNGEKILVPVELIREYDLCEGDVVACKAQKGQQAYVATEICSINEITVTAFKRTRFETAEVCYPQKALCLYKNATANIVAAKYIDWLLPMYHGQRSVIVAPPKAGKTSLLFQMANAAIKADSASKVFVLLNGQSPELIGEFRKNIPSSNLVYSMYDDSPERQVFVAEYILKRAKRYVESGKNVLLFVDSLNTLARAYNETDESSGGKVLAGGLESKTLLFLKKYFGAARCLEKGGSLTICACVNVQTGNPADDLIGEEMCALANHELRLSQALAVKRIYPAIDLLHSKKGEVGLDVGGKDDELYTAVCHTYLPKMGEEALIRLLNELPSMEALLHNIKMFSKKK